MRILGIDPGVATTGWAIVDFDENSKPYPMDYGAIITSKELTTSERLVEIYSDLNELIDKFKPEYAGVETLLFYNNAKTAITVGEARGIVLLTLQQHDIPLTEFTPLQVKDSITGYGKANKKQVQESVKLLCELDNIPQPDDAADALAIAITTEVVVSRKVF